MLGFSLHMGVEVVQWASGLWLTSQCGGLHLCVVSCCAIGGRWGVLLDCEKDELAVTCWVARLPMIVSSCHTSVLQQQQHSSCVSQLLVHGSGSGQCLRALQAMRSVRAQGPILTCTCHRLRSSCCRHNNSCCASQGLSITTTY